MLISPAFYFPYRTFQSTHPAKKASFSSFSQINLRCHFLCSLMMFSFLYLTDWDYFVCKSVAAAKCIYNCLGRLVKVELWRTSCPQHFNITYFTFLQLTQDYTGLFPPSSFSSVATRSRLKMDVRRKVMTTSQPDQKRWDENKAGWL